MQDDTDFADLIDEIDQAKAADEVTWDPDEGRLVVPKGYQITDDEGASRALRKVRRIETEIKRLTAGAKADKAATDLWLETVLRPLKAELEFREDHLTRYHEGLEAAAESKADVAQTYRVPGGEIYRKKDPDVVEFDDLEGDETWQDHPFVVWCIDHGRLDLLDIKPAGKKAVKDASGIRPDVERDKDGKAISPSGEYRYIDEDGETVPGVVYRVGADSRGVRAS